MRPYRKYTNLHLPPGEDDRGANDEGFYWFFCECRGEETEHEDGACCLCGEVNDPTF
jgi:hypothetical protein